MPGSSTRGNARFRKCLHGQVALLLVLLIVILLGLRQWSKVRIWHQKQSELLAIVSQGYGIVAHLETYRAQHAYYPTELSHRWLPPAPITRWGRSVGENWLYKVTPDGRSYTLFIYLPGDVYPFGWHFWTALMYHPGCTYPHEELDGILVAEISGWGFYVE